MPTKLNLTKFKFAVPVLSIMLGAVAVPAFAQNNGGGGGQNGGGQNGQNGGGGGRGNWNPQQMQQRILDRLKTQLGATDDEFAALSPKITAVMTAERDVMAGTMMGGRGGRRGPGGNQAGQGGANATPQSDLAKAMADLQTTLDNKDATPDDIKGKLEAVRTAKKAAKETLSKAQDDLKSVLTQRQEAVLVESGLLE